MEFTFSEKRKKLLINNNYKFGFQKNIISPRPIVRYMATFKREPIKLDFVKYLFLNSATSRKSLGSKAKDDKTPLSPKSE